MKIKRYTGKTTYDAIQKLKIELGESAVILHTRKIKQPGLLGFFKKPHVEILAAEDEQQLKHGKEDVMYDKASPREDVEYKPKIDKDSLGLLEEMKEMRKMMASLKKGLDVSESDDEHLPDFLKFYESLLIDGGVNQKIAKKILKDIYQKYNLKDNQEKIKEVLLYNFLGTFGNPEPIKMTNDQKIIFFIGPTGVGKTTTMAKLAAQYTLDNYDVGLITADTYRVGAVEQLKVYANILNVPLKIMYDIKDIYSSLSNFKNKDIIFIDTAGRSHQDEDKMEDIKELVGTISNPETFLVLSATTNYSTLQAIIDQYNFIENYKIIFTKIDEIENYGIFLNTKLYADKPLSYVTTGQNVPDDIEILNITKLCKTLIGDI